MPDSLNLQQVADQKGAGAGGAQASLPGAVDDGTSVRPAMNSAADDKTAGSGDTPAAGVGAADAAPRVFVAGVDGAGVVSSADDLASEDSRSAEDYVHDKYGSRSGKVVSREEAVGGLLPSHSGSATPDSVSIDAMVVADQQAKLHESILEATAGHLIWNRPVTTVHKIFDAVNKWMLDVANLKSVQNNRRYEKLIENMQNMLDQLSKGEQSNNAAQSAGAGADAGADAQSEAEVSQNSSYSQIVRAAA